MITVEDMKDMSALTRAEISALADHEHTSIFDATLMEIFKKQKTGLQ